MHLNLIRFSSVLPHRVSHLPKLIPRPLYGLHSTVCPNLLDASDDVNHLPLNFFRIVSPSYFYFRIIDL